jgi:hypothetical protein
MPMDRDTQARWRQSLERKGAQRIQAELDLRPGRPSDPMFGIGEAPPYPTRAFCSRWCLGRGEPGTALYAAALIGVAALFVVCLLHTEMDWPDAPAHRSGYAMATPPPLGPRPTSDDGIANTSVIDTTVTRSILPSCSWVDASDAWRTVQRLPSCAKLGSGSTAADPARG